ncbi:MAG: hypothetical protein KBD76_07605 [Bacteriovorax sp.]|nr:hypothetical protein [Bacteriovorax sp.]
MRDLIFSIIESFYQKAINDIIIGYHFQKFNDPEVLAHHLERLSSFWEMQLTGTTSKTFDKPFHLLFTHLQLNIKKGELGRWIILFHQTLEEYESSINHPNMTLMSELWKKRIALFEERFIAHPQMFRQN